MSRPWMPLYIADYLADTGHLSAAEHGAYLLLIMHYWQTGGLPDDDARLARIARMTDPEWAAARPVLLEFFGPCWTHERIDGELAEAERLSAQGRLAGVASANARKVRNPRPKGQAKTKDSTEPSTDCEPNSQPKSNEPVNGMATERQPEGQRNGNRTPNGLATETQPPQPLPQPQKIAAEEPRARARDPTCAITPEAFAVTDEIMLIVGIDRAFIAPGWCGAPMRVQSWINQGWTRAVIIAGVQMATTKRRFGPPSCVNYFEKPIAQVVADGRALVPTAQPGNHNGTTHAKLGNVIPAADRLIERLRRINEPAPEEPLRLGARALPVRTVSQG